MRFSTSPLLSAVMLCAASQSAVGAMALMDLDSRQILQLEGNLLFITEPLAEQLNGFPGMADKPVKAGETATEAFVARLAGSVSIFVSRVVFRGAANHGCPSCYRGLKINDQRLRGTLSRRHKCA